MYYRDKWIEWQWVQIQNTEFIAYYYIKNDTGPGRI